jgi:hypothetical protein
MAVPRRNMNGPAGRTGLVHLHACTLAAYTAGGATAPAVGDIVTIDTTGNWYVERAPDNATKRLGQVTKIELAPSGTDVGYVVVEWFDCERVVEVDTDDATSVTLGNSLIKDGDTSVADNFDAGATTGSIIAVSKSAASGAIKAYGMVFYA